MKWVDADGIERRASSDTEDEEVARRLLGEIERQELERAPVGRAKGITVARFYEETWLPQRKLLRPFAWRNDASRLKHHFLPYFGDRVLADLATDRGEVDLLDWLLALRSRPSQRDGKPLGSRTVWNLASIVRVFFADALERKKIRRDPTLGWRADRHLPRKEDKEKGWRQRAGFTLAQAVKLTTDPRIPEDRRVLYALRFLGGGLRPGEAANARWRELDRTAEPLWRLSISSAFNTHELQEKTTKTGAELNVPVHPVLQRALAAWWDTGWARLMGREPTQDDLIVPRPEGGQRRVTTTLLQFYADLAAVGLPKQRQYESRSTFRNLALRAGASEFHVNLITHPKPQKAADFYTRLEQQWEGMCRAVLAIDAGAWAGCAVADGAAESALAPRRVVTVQGYSSSDPYGSGWEIPKKNAPPPLTGGGAQMVTPTGLEVLAFGFAGRINQAGSRASPPGILERTRSWVVEAVHKSTHKATQLHVSLDSSWTRFGNLPPPKRPSEFRSEGAHQSSKSPSLDAQNGRVMDAVDRCRRAAIAVARDAAGKARALA